MNSLVMKPGYMCIFFNWEALNKAWVAPRRKQAILRNTSIFYVLHKTRDQAGKSAMEEGCRDCFIGASTNLGHEWNQWNVFVIINVFCSPVKASTRVWLQGQHWNFATPSYSPVFEPWDSFFPWSKFESLRTQIQILLRPCFSDRTTSQRSTLNMDLNKGYKD